MIPGSTFFPQILLAFQKKKLNINPSPATFITGRSKAAVLMLVLYNVDFVMNNFRVIYNVCIRSAIISNAFPGVNYTKCQWSSASVYL